MARDYNFNVILRPEHLAGDTTSTKETIIHAINAAEIGAISGTIVTTTSNI
jgi:CMP-N-acetylneuraminic acid synthetase